IILGSDWLLEHNPEMDWQSYILEFTRCPESCKISEEGNDAHRWAYEGIKAYRVQIGDPIPEDSSIVNDTEYPALIQIRAQGNKSIELAEKAAQGQKEKTLEEMVLKEYQKYRKVFEKGASERFP
ncbi:hypothetical protein JAAARDRAFT_95269, partial [Jaapia argillacea MUCL 33604]